MHNYFRCPVCHLVLEKEKERYLCSNNHSFDLAKKGYLNLLLANQKGSKEPGDSKEMVRSRRNFLNQGYYEPLSRRLNQIIVQLMLSDHLEKANILDAGCGEGYFTHLLKEYLLTQEEIPPAVFWGIDISKWAINYAAGRDKEINFAVASNYNLPLLADSIDYILWTFAPGDEGEFKRVLHPQGKLIMVIPGTRHLFGLKQLVYQEAWEHEPKETISQGFRLLASHQVSYTIELNKTEDILSLLAMTPYYWHITALGRKKAEEAANLQTEVDFLIIVYERLS